MTLTCPKYTEVIMIVSTALLRIRGILILQLRCKPAVKNSRSRVSREVRAAAGEWTVSRRSRSLVTCQS